MYKLNDYVIMVIDCIISFTKYLISIVIIAAKASVY